MALPNMASPRLLLNFVETRGQKPAIHLDFLTLTRRGRKGSIRLTRLSGDRSLG
jgi:hypothetical protein